MTSQKLTRMLEELNANPKRFTIPNAYSDKRTFSQFSFQEMRARIEGANPNRTYKPLRPDVAFSNWQGSGAQLDPHTQKVCPICKLVISRTRHHFTYRYGGPSRIWCPRCGCKLSF